MVIADSSTLIHLAAIDRLELLRIFYGKIVVPEAARRVAGTFGIPKTGVIGVLIRAKAEGRIPSLRFELDRLRHAAGFWIAEDLYQKALAAVGEELPPKAPTE